MKTQYPKNSLEDKEERRKIRYLQWITFYWNKEGYREIEGQMYPFQRAYRNFVQEYLDGKIKLIKKGGEYIMEDPNTTVDSSVPAQPSAAAEPAVSEQPAVPTEPAHEGESTSSEGGETPATPEAPAEGGEVAPAEPEVAAEPAT